LIVGRWSGREEGGGEKLSVHAAAGDNVGLVRNLEHLRDLGRRSRFAFDTFILPPDG
jgi:hypothetical protein